MLFDVKRHMFAFQGHISSSQESCVSFTHSHPNPFIIFLYGVKKSAFICVVYIYIYIYIYISYYLILMLFRLVHWPMGKLIMIIQIILRVS